MSIDFRRTILIFILLFCSISQVWANEPMAREKSRILVRAGAVWIETDSIESSMSFADTDLPGAQLSVDDKSHYAVFLTWMATDNFALETVISTPIYLDINAGGGLLGDEFRAGEIEVLPLMLIGRYNSPWTWQGFQPFVGLGATYLWFKDTSTTDTFDALAAVLGGQDAKIAVKNQWRPVLELGIDYQFDEYWFANFTWLYIEGDTEVVTSFSNGPQLIADVSYAPQFLALTVGYRF